MTGKGLWAAFSLAVVGLAAVPWGGVSGQWLAEGEYWPGDLDVHYVPTPQPVVDEMLRMAEVSGNDVLYDLGSGDGRIVISAAERFGARGVGIDLDPVRVQEGRENAAAAGVAERVEFIHGDLFEADLSDASVVTIYLLSSLNERLRPKLLEELRPGSRVVSHAFDMGQWEPDTVSASEGGTVYLWVVPAHAEGRWNVSVRQPVGPREFTLSLEQTFQLVQGNALVDGSQLPIENGRLNGEVLEFEMDMPGTDGNIERQRFQARVNGNSMSGQIVAGSDGSRLGGFQANRDAIAEVMPQGGNE